MRCHDANRMRMRMRMRIQMRIRIRIRMRMRMRMKSSKYIHSQHILGTSAFHSSVYYTCLVYSVQPVKMSLLPMNKTCSFGYMYICLFMMRPNCAYIFYTQFRGLEIWQFVFLEDHAKIDNKKYI